MPAGPRGSELTAVTLSTETTKSISVVLRTFDTLTNPCSYLQEQLASRIRAETGVPSSATLTCDLQSFSVLYDSRREYRWTVTASWTV